MNVAVTVSEESEDVKDRDIFREIPLRYFGYANEVGEAFRSLVHVRFVHFSYLVASVYVVSHAVSRGSLERRNQKKNWNHESNNMAVKHESIRPALLIAMDTLLWQGLASVAVPGLVVNRTCAFSKVVLNTILKSASSPFKRYTVTAIGLCIIPFIINPIDRSVDKFMENLIRPCYQAHEPK